MAAAKASGKQLGRPKGAKGKSKLDGREEEIKELLKMDTNINVYDSIAIETAKAELGSSVNYSETMQDCVEKSDLVIITTSEPEFQNIDVSKNYNMTIIDCWRQLLNVNFSSNVKYHAVGLFNDD